MKNEKFINGLKSGGITVVIIYSILGILLEIIDNIISGKNVTINSSNGFGKLTVFVVIYAILTAGLYGSSNDIIEGKLISFSTFMKNGKRYFSRTLGYTMLYGLAFCFVIIIPLIVISFSNFSFSNFSFSNISVIVTLLLTSVFQSILNPLIILNVIDKYTKGYFKKNYVIILIFSLIACSLNLIPIVGKFFFIILDGFYPLLILSMCDSVEPTECYKDTMQDVNNNN